MNFLGLRLCDHDSNITLTLDDKVHYYKAERDWQIKHYGYEDLTTWLKAFDKWNIPLSRIDAIGIVVDCYRYKSITYDENEVFEEIEIPLFRLLGFRGKIYRVDHHYAHALSVWPLGVKPDIDFIFDGYGDNKLSHTIMKGDKRDFAVTYETHPSFGSTMGDVGAILKLPGMSNDMAGKVMALKGFGRHSDEELSKMKAKNKTENLTIADIRDMWNLWKLGNLVKLYSGGHDRQGADTDQVVDHIQYAHSVTEDIYEKYFVTNTNETDVISYSGGIALNTIINSRIKRQRPNLHIPPHSNDEGLSLGVVEALRREYRQPEFSNEGFPFWQSDYCPKHRPTKEVIKKTAESLAQGQIVGWYQGRGEVGPRALGNRSILMNPTIKNGKDIINAKVKHREPFRPFGASVLADKCSTYFDWEYDSPYMLYCMDVRDKESFAPITHVDGTCRPQTVTPDQEDYYELLTEFEKLTGIPMLLNTSLNNGGKPIVGHPSEALQLLNETEMNALCVGNTLYTK